MKFFVSGLLACLIVPGCLSAAEIKGKIVDPSGAPIAGAQVSVLSRVGVEAQTASSGDGSFGLSVDDRWLGSAKLAVTSPGFRTTTQDLQRQTTKNDGLSHVVQLEIA